MISPRIHRFCAGLALAVYLLAGIATPFCHNHPLLGEYCGPHCEAHHHHGDVHDGDDHDHGPADHDAGLVLLSADDEAVHCGHCAACEYSAQAACTAFSVCELSFETLVDIQPALTARLPISLALKSFAARAPPQSV